MTRKRPRRTGFWFRTARGSTAHVQGDPQMDVKTLEALEQLIDAAHEAIRTGALGEKGKGE